MTKRYVVRVDGSDTGRHALRWAIGQAALEGALVHAVHVWSVPPQISSIAASGPLVDPSDYELWAKDSLAADVALTSREAGRPKP
jgi:nucleotide-binding universal stress UspA family protein